MKQGTASKSILMTQNHVSPRTNVGVNLQSERIYWPGGWHPIPGTKPWIFPYLRCTFSGTKSVPLPGSTYSVDA